MEWTEQNSTKGKPNDVFNFGYKLWVIREHFWFFIKAITIDKIHNNKKKDTKVRNNLSYQRPGFTPR